MKKSLSFMIMPLIFCAVIILVFVSEQVFDTAFWHFGIYPRKLSGLTGVIFSPLLHGGIEHLLSNLSALPVLTGLLTALYRRNYFRIFCVLYIATGISVWFFARESYHIGASGLIYALASFLFFGGIISDKKGSAAVSLLTVMLYGSMVWGIFPLEEHVSWESHALGAVVGFFSAFVFVKEKPKKVLTDEDFDYQRFQFNDFSQTENYNKIKYGYKL
jgi:membrane associated rhomboid family serine protease